MNVFLDLVGCRLNQSEIEAFARQFRLAGHSLVSEPGEADLAVINTCTVTSAAAADSRQKVRHAIRAGARQVIVTGCHATLKPGDFTELPGAIQVIDNAAKDHLVPSVLNLPSSMFDQISSPREPVPGHRLRTRAFIKVQDGCDNFCTYCITRLARGRGQSRPMQNVLMDIRAALDAGCQEVVLTGVHLGSWGYDFDRPSHLQYLVQEILVSTNIPRLHLSSIEPWDISAEFLNLWNDHRLIRHLHLPLQSGCTATLKRMGRKIIPTTYADTVRMARQLIPGVSITTDIITGFPGETETEFAECSEFVQTMNFAGGHVFTFSPRPGTAAVNLPDQVKPAIAKQRNAKMRKLLEQSASAYQLQHVGQVLSVLWEKVYAMNEKSWQLSGLSENYLHVRALSPNPCKNQTMSVYIMGSEPAGLIGEIFLK